MQRSSVLQRVQVGAELTPGDRVAASKRLMSLNITPVPQIDADAVRGGGSKASNDVTHGKEWTEADYEGRLAFNDLAYLLSGVLDTAAVTTPDGATTARLWTFLPDNWEPDTPKTFTFEVGSSAGAERWAYGLLQSLILRITRAEVAVSGAILGQKLAEGIVMTAGPTSVDLVTADSKRATTFVGDTLDTTEVQQVTVGTHTGGTFTLAFMDQTTGALAYNSTAEAIQTALEGLSTIGKGHVTVTGAGPWSVEFTGRFAGLEMPLLEIDGGNLTGGANQAVTRTTPAGMARLTGLQEAEWNLSDRFTPVYGNDEAEPSYHDHVEGEMDHTAQIVIPHDATSQGYMADLRAKRRKYFTILINGPEIEDGYPYCFRLDIPFKFLTPDRGENDDLFTGTYDLEPIYDATLGGFLRARLWCALADL